MRPTDEVPVDPAEVDETDAPVPDDERPVQPPGAGSGSGDPVPDEERTVPPDDPAADEA